MARDLILTQASSVQVAGSSRMKMTETEKLRAWAQYHKDHLGLVDIHFFPGFRFKDFTIEEIAKNINDSLESLGIDITNEKL